MWYSGGTGYDCVQPGAHEYDPSADTTVITYDGRTYYCRVVGVAPAPPPPADSDADGVADGTDACPTVAAATPNGCPPPASPALDSDGDGISDDFDGCPSAPAATDDGCPAPTRVYIGATGGPNTRRRSPSTLIGRPAAGLELLEALDRPGGPSSPGGP